jgi:hypothetical protein
LTSRTRSDEVLAWMREANPVSDAEIREELNEEQLDRAMAQAVAAGERADEPMGPNSRRSHFPRPSMPTLGLGAGLASIAAFAALTLFGGSSVGGGQPAFAAAAVEVAEANPRLLVTAPGWEVLSAGEFEADSGEITFGDGTHQLSVVWEPAGLYRSYLPDGAEAGSDPVKSTLLGHVATTWGNGGGVDFRTVLSPEDAVFLRIDGRVAGKGEFDQLLDSLQPVDVNTWLSAMPAGVVRPDARAAAVEEILTEVPLPPGFDVAALASETAVLDRYQLGAKVTGAVACEWIERWVAATKAGDAAKAQASVDAMATSHDWPILRQMADEGGWSQVLWITADDLRKGQLDTGVSMIGVGPGGKRFAYGPGYATGLGCKSQYRKPLEG